MEEQKKLEVVLDWNGEEGFPKWEEEDWTEELLKHGFYGNRSHEKCNAQNKMFGGKLNTDHLPEFCRKKKSKEF